MEHIRLNCIQHLFGNDAGQLTPVACCFCTGDVCGGAGAAEPSKEAAKTSDNGEAGERQAFEARAMLYQYDNAAAKPGWRQCGTGVMRINVLPSGQSRMVMRQDKTFRVLMNALLIPELSLQRQAGAQQVTFTCVNSLHSGLFSAANGAAPMSSDTSDAKAPADEPTAGATVPDAGAVLGPAAPCSAHGPAGVEDGIGKTHTGDAATHAAHADSGTQAGGASTEPERAQADPGKQDKSAAGPDSAPALQPPNNAEPKPVAVSAMQTYAVKFGSIQKADEFEQKVAKHKHSATADTGPAQNAAQKDEKSVMDERSVIKQ